LSSNPWFEAISLSWSKLIVVFDESPPGAAGAMVAGVSALGPSTLCKHAKAVSAEGTCTFFQLSCVWCDGARCSGGQI